MSQTLPPKVRAAKDEAHHVFDWAVPAQLDGKPLAIAGTLDYQPPGSQAPKTLILVGILGLIVALGGVAMWLRYKRERRTTQGTLIEAIRAGAAHAHTAGGSV